MANPFLAAANSQKRDARGVGTSYAGARMSRLTEDWILASILSADQEVQSSLRTLRARSRELSRDNDLASRYVSLVEENVVGADGMRLQARVTRPDRTPDNGINQRIEDAFAEWSEPENASVDGRLSWADIQQLVARTVPGDGESIIRLVGGFRGNRFGFALQLLDADQLDEEYDRPVGTGPNGQRRNEIRMGVEWDQWRRPVAYHLWDHHPSDHTARGRERVRVPAADISHLYRHGRVAQSRGVPWFAPALFKIKMVAGYEEAEVVAARTAAAKGGFFVLNDDAVVPNPEAPDAGGPIRTEVEPGVFDRLPAGWTFKEWDPQHPTTAFSDFHKAMVRGIATGLDVSYTALANDLEHVNFSSIRAGLLSERDAWRKYQAWLVSHLHRRVYLAWLTWALTTGALRLPSRNRDRWSKHRWQTRGWPWVDPDKDLSAAAKEIRLGLNSRTRLAAERGRDFEEILRELAQEEEMAREMGVALTTDLSTGGSPQAPAPADGDEDAEAQVPAALLARTNGRAYADEG